MSNVGINWASIERKIQDAATPKIRKELSMKLPSEFQLLAEEFKKIMYETIMYSPEMTPRESAVVADTGFDLTRCYLVSVSFNKDRCLATVEMNFDFTGDKTLESISPNKHVEDMTVLFNNGYQDNNVDPDRPPFGKWHGFTLVIQPGFKLGAHFVSQATTKFVDRLRSGGLDVRYFINGKYK